MMHFISNQWWFDTIKQNYIIPYTSLAKSLCNTNWQMPSKGEVLSAGTDAKGQGQQPVIAELCALDQLMLP